MAIYPVCSRVSWLHIHQNLHKHKGFHMLVHKMCLNVDIPPRVNTFFVFSCSIEELCLVIPGQKASKKSLLRLSCIVFQVKNFPDIHNSQHD